MQQDKEASEALTGRILHTDGNDMVVEQAVEGRPVWPARQSLQKAGLIVALLALLGTVVGLSIGFSHSRAAAASSIDPACIHALGGGSIRAGGGLDSAAPDYCKAQLQAYARPDRGSYWREVEISMLAAMSVFGFSHNSSPVGTPVSQQLHLHNSPPAARQPPQQPQDDWTAGQLHHLSRSLLRVSARSIMCEQLLQGGQGLLGGPVAAAGQQQPMKAPEPGHDKVVVFDIDETVLSNMQQVLDPVTWPWDAWVEAAQAPPLQPTLRFYQALCAAGFSVAFVTGRKEASRNATMHNLDIAGYGGPCKAGPGPFYGTRAAASSSSSNEGGPEAGSCCYSALYLRQPGDTRLASVYKPAARKDLLAAGNMTLVALVGDQFSDLNGEESAPYAFKLPNPFYYIL